MIRKLEEDGHACILLNKYTNILHTEHSMNVLCGQFVSM